MRNVFRYAAIFAVVTAIVIIDNQSRHLVIDESLTQPEICLYFAGPADRVDVYTLNLSTMDLGNWFVTGKTSLAVKDVEAGTTHCFTMSDVRPGEQTMLNGWVINDQNPEWLVDANGSVAEFTIEGSSCEFRASTYDGGDVICTN